MTLGHYILDEAHQPVEADMMTWGRWFENGQNGEIRRVWWTATERYRVSTVFLGMDHNWRPEGEPVLWETMVFAGPKGSLADEYCERHSSWAEAIEGHRVACEWAEENMP